MEFDSLQCTGKVGDKVHNKFPTKLRTQIMKVGDMICVMDFHDLCPRLCRELVPDCHKVGIMEFGLNTSKLSAFIVLHLHLASALALNNWPRPRCQPHSSCLSLSLDLILELEMKCEGNGVMPFIHPNNIGTKESI